MPRYISSDKRVPQSGKVVPPFGKIANDTQEQSNYNLSSYKPVIDKGISGIPRLRQSDMLKILKKEKSSHDTVSNTDIPIA